ncbi:kinase-like protein [Gymnopus androsaceus JB14]|uniref:Kinase-like protein n=1 Tax=Gymnopus androsaceus JB14 TaxID=1447944 RepID=A0A6A4GIA6_9AGAR|nr:kinase-like protein [Gymnopus androsaceus JB14]
MLLSWAILRLPSRTEHLIMQKLGFGGYATVWLAQQTDKLKFVAVKITTAESSDDTEREAAMLKQVNSPNVLTLLDYLRLQGPNGCHSVLVTEVLVPAQCFLAVELEPKRTPAWCKSVARGLAQGLANIHAAGLVYGDFHFGNFGFAVPQINQRDQRDIMQDLELWGSKPCLPSFGRTSNFILTCLPRHPILDFGNGQWCFVFLCKFRTLQAPIQLTKPARYAKVSVRINCLCSQLAIEVVVERTENPLIESPVDVWTLGAVIYELITTSDLFYRLSMIKRLESNEWWSGLSNPPEVSASHADVFWEKCHAELRLGCLDDTDAVAPVRLLRKILVLDPDARPTAAEVLEDLVYWPILVMFRSSSLVFAFTGLVSIVNAQSAVSGTWAQCGGIGYAGPTVCVSGTVCTFLNAYFSQCLPSDSAPSSTATSSPPGSTSSASAANFWFSFGDSYTQTAFTPSGNPPQIGQPLGNPLTLVEQPSMRLWLPICSYSVVVDGSGVNEFLSGTANKPATAPWTSENALFSIWIGINDLSWSWWQTGDRLAYNDVLLDAEFALVEQLYAVGARNFLFLNVPPIQRTPYFASLGPTNVTGPILESVIEDFNTKLATAANNLTSTFDDVQTFYWDSYSTFNGILDDPTAFGFTNVATFGSAPGLFWGNDNQGLHPSSAAHEIFGQDVAAVLADAIW